MTHRLNMNVVHYSLKVGRVLENNDNKKTKQNCEKEREGKDSGSMACLIRSQSFTPSTSSIVFTSRYLCFGPEGPDIVSIPTSQNKHKPDTIISFVSIPQHLNQLPFMAVSHYYCLVLQEEDDYLFPSQPLHLAIYLLRDLPISRSHLLFLPRLSLLPSLVAPVPFTSDFVYCDAVFILPNHFASLYSSYHMSYLIFTHLTFFVYDFSMSFSLVPFY